jgi:hypothetical protein
MGMRASLREVREGDLTRLSDRNQVYGLFARDDPAALSLEKSWDGLHRLLTAAGREAELGFLVGGGTEVGVPLSYGRPRLLSADFVRRLDAALRGMTDDQFWSGFDPHQFEADGVYPGIWNEPPDDLREEYVSYLHDVREFVGLVAASGGQIVVVIL